MVLVLFTGVYASADGLRCMVASQKIAEVEVELPTLGFFIGKKIVVSRRNVDPRISDFQVKNIVRAFMREGIPFAPLTSVRVLGREELQQNIIPVSADSIYLGKITSNGVEQLIKENSALDTLLIRESKVDSSPIEVAKVLIKSSNGEIVFESEIIKGQSEKIANDQILEVIRDGLEKSEVQEGEISVIHSHPYWDVVVDGYLRMGALSLGDVRSAKEISELYTDFVVKERAVLPNGWGFETDFRRGRFLVLPSD